MGGRGGGAPFKTMQDRNTRSSVADHGKKKGNEIDEKQPGELLWKRRKVMHEARVCAVRREEKWNLAMLWRSYVSFPLGAKKLSEDEGNTGLFNRQMIFVDSKKRFTD